jgi:hypothetical protein
MATSVAGHCDRDSSMDDAQPLPTLLEGSVRPGADKDHKMSKNTARDAPCEEMRQKPFATLRDRRPGFTAPIKLHPASSLDGCPHEVNPTLFFLPDVPDPESRRNREGGCRGKMVDWSEFWSAWTSEK